MELVITATTGKGDYSSEREVKETFRQALRIASLVNGRIIYGRGLNDGTEIVISK